jgi:hypothetical protein
MKKIFPIFLSPLILFSSHSPDFFTVELGGFDFTREKYRTLELDLEYKFQLKFLRSPFQILEFRPLVGVMGNARGSGYLYLGIDFDLLFFDHFLFSPGFAAGYYWRGSGKDLGYPIEFRSGIELGWQFSDYRRLGLHFYHLSNASLGKRNPGEESLVLFYDIPITKGFPFYSK